jgi:hypothetical protein
MNASPGKIEECGGIDAAAFRAELIPAYRPVVLRGLVRAWPAVEAALRSDGEAASYVASFDRGAEVDAFVGAPEIGGRFFYREDMGFNFERRRGPLREILRDMLSIAAQPGGPAVYVGSAPIPEVLPGFEARNRLELVDPVKAVPRIWIGNRSTVSTHFDLSDNIACVVAGRRRFTLFPPDQLPNLYVGPLDHTMAGQPASMVDLNDPDFQRFPRFREALAAAVVAELEPGDAIYIPTLWWHQIEALSPFNILVNHWWEDAPPDRGSMFEAMVHAIFAAGTMPPERLETWRLWFDHYVFRANGDPAAHLAPPHRGILGASNPPLRQRLRQFLLRTLGGR